MELFKDLVAQNWRDWDTGVSNVLPGPVSAKCCHVLFRAVMSGAQHKRKHCPLAPSIMVVQTSQGVLMRGTGLGSGLECVASLFIKKRGNMLERWVQWLKALAALAEDLEFSSQYLCGGSPLPSCNSRRFDDHFSLPHAYGAQSNRCSLHIHLYT